MKESILSMIRHAINRYLCNLISRRTEKAYTEVKNEIVNFLLKTQDRHSVILTYLANVALSDSFGTLLSCFNSTLEIIDKADKNEQNARSTAYRFIFLYLKIKLELKVFYLHRLIKKTVVCPYCGKQTLLLLKYKSSVVCQNCGNTL